MSTRLATDELLASITVPVQPASERWSFQSFCRRQGDYAIVAVGLLLTVRESHIERIRIALSGAAGTAVRLPEVESRWAGQMVERSLAERLARDCAATVSPIAGDGATAGYRRALVGTLVERAVHQALQNPREIVQ
jgi:CO/xanthine dehydrogenase FAD-binding subunit